MWVCRNVIGTTHQIDGEHPTHKNGDEWGMVQMALLYQHYLQVAGWFLGQFCWDLSSSTLEILEHMDKKKGGTVFFPWSMVEDVDLKHENDGFQEKNRRTCGISGWEVSCELIFIDIQNLCMVDRTMKNWDFVHEQYWTGML